jgi:hypothetical protein
VSIETPYRLLDGKEGRELTAHAFEYYNAFQVNPSTLLPKGVSLLRVDPERRFFLRLKRQGLAPPNGSRRNIE